MYGILFPEAEILALETYVPMLSPEVVGEILKACAQRFAVSKNQIGHLGEGFHGPRLTVCVVVVWLSGFFFPRLRSVY